LNEIKTLVKLISNPVELKQMRKAVYITGTLFSAITLLSILFKMLHWQGAQTLLILGVVGLALIFIPLFAIYSYMKRKNR